MVTKKTDPKKGKDSKKVDKTKIVMKKVTSGGGSKAKKKKWSKGKVRDKLNNQAFLTSAAYEKASKEISKMAYCTPAIVSERLKLKVSVSRALLKDLIDKGLMKVVIKSADCLVCTKSAEEPAAATATTTAASA